MFSVWGPVHFTGKRQINRREGIQIYEYFLCAQEFTEVKFKGVFRLGSLYNILTKERGFGLQGSVNRGTN